MVEELLKILCDFPQPMVFYFDNYNFRLDFAFYHVNRDEKQNVKYKKQAKS